MEHLQECQHRDGKSDYLPIATASPSGDCLALAGLRRQSNFNPFQLNARKLGNLTPLSSVAIFKTRHRLTAFELSLAFSKHLMVNSYSLSASLLSQDSSHSYCRSK